EPIPRPLARGWARRPVASGDPCEDRSLGRRLAPGGWARCEPALPPGRRNFRGACGTLPPGETAHLSGIATTFGDRAKSSARVAPGLQITAFAAWNLRRF